MVAESLRALSRQTLRNTTPRLSARSSFHRAASSASADWAPPVMKVSTSRSTFADSCSSRSTMTSMPIRRSASLLLLV